MIKNNKQSLVMRLKAIFPPTSIWWYVWMQMFLFSDCKQICKFLFGDVPQNSFKIWEMTET